MVDFPLRKPQEREQVHGEGGPRKERHDTHDCTMPHSLYLKVYQLAETLEQLIQEAQKAEGILK
jgi:hypothetical protein